MKQIFLFYFSCLFIFSVQGQSKILKLDAANGSFKNYATLPSYESFIIEGEIEKDIALVEVAINESKSKKVKTYSWNRVPANQSANFEVIVTDGLLGSSEYDFLITTYKTLDDDSKKLLLKALMQKVYAYLNAQVIIEKNRLIIDKPDKTFKILNEIVVDGMSLQRSRNGINLTSLSDLIREEINKVNRAKLKKLIFKKGDEKVEMLEITRVKKVEYLVTLVYDEVLSFYESELVQLYRSYTIDDAKTEKSRFTLPINAGIYGYTTSADFSKIGASNSGLQLGVGFTIPIIRNYSIKGKKMPSLGISLGVLTGSIKDDLGNKYSTPGINIPVYGAIGFGFLRVLRLNVGTAVVAPHKTSPVKKLYWYPVVGLTFELEGWLGIKR